MTDEEFDKLVRRLETVAKDNPSSYKRRVFGLAVLGYIYVFGVLLTIIALTGGISWLLIQGHHWILLKKLAIPLVIVIWMILRALWVRVEAPDGIRLKQRDFPVLFNTLDKIGKRLKGPRFHEVLLTDEFNAAVTQIPRLGIFGWQKNYLVLGLPLMQALSPKEFVAVLAHEYGHLSGAHARFGGWIYRVRKSWHQIYEAFQQSGHWAQWVFRRFLSWYAPYFSAYSFVLARANEYEADHASARVIGARTAADALINVHIKGDVAENKYWSSLYKRADSEPEPIRSAFVDLAKVFHQPIGQEDVAGWLKAYLATETGTADTHPSLADRLAHLKQEPRVPPAEEKSAAEALLGKRATTLAQILSKQWFENMKESWKERYQHVQQSLQRLAELDDAAASGHLPVDDQVERVWLVEEFRNQEEALSLAQAVVRESPDHAPANYVVGRLLLERGDETGIPCIEKAMSADEDYVKAGCKLVYEYLLETGREQEAEIYYDRFYRQVDKEDDAQAERDNFSFDDDVLPHGLDQDVLVRLGEQLRPFKRIKEAYFVRKKIEKSEAPVYILSFSVRWWAGMNTDDMDKYQQKIADEVDFPGECFVISLNNSLGSGRKKFYQRIKNITGSRIPV